VIKDVDPERIQKLVGCMRESVRILDEIKVMEEPEFHKDIHRSGFKTSDCVREQGAGR
jgi:hypothetical protein